MRDQFGETLVFTRINQMTFTWDVPDAEPAAEYMRAVNLGLMEYLDEQEEAE